MSCQLNLQYDAAIFPLNDRIGADVNAIAAQILSCPQIKRAIVLQLFAPHTLVFCVSGCRRCVRRGANARKYRDYSGDRGN
jgi:hypothetical protein